MKQYGLIQALDNTLKKWEEIRRLASDLHLLISTKCDLCFYFHSNCDICSAKEDLICSALPQDEPPLTKWYRCYKNSKDIVKLSVEICEWLENKIKELIKEEDEDERNK